MLEGKVWTFGDDINTDLIAPTPYIYMPAKDQAKHVFEANRPGWVNDMKAGDFIVAGRNFGMGSSRPAPMVLNALVARLRDRRFHQCAVLPKLRQLRPAGARMSRRLQDVPRGPNRARFI